MDYEFLKDSLLTLLVAIDPPGLVPIFIALTAGATLAQKRRIAHIAIVVAFCILSVTAIGGAALLTAIGISLPAFRIAGGLMLFYIGWEMIFSKRKDRKHASADHSVEQDNLANIAVFPLALPMISGPGSITATILLASKNEHDPLQTLLLIGCIFVVLALCWLGFYLSDRVNRFMGYTGNVILERLLGILLTALAVQITGDGVKAFFG